MLYEFSFKEQSHYELPGGAIVLVMLLPSFLIDFPPILFKKRQQRQTLYLDYITNAVVNTVNRLIVKLVFLRKKYIFLCLFIFVYIFMTFRAKSWQFNGRKQHCPLEVFYVVFKPRRETLLYALCMVGSRLYIYM